MTSRLLLDHSAWARLTQAALPGGREEEVLALLESRALVVCLPFLLEVGYSARSADDHSSQVGRLLRLPRADLNHRVERRALDAQRQLARTGHHRLPLADLIVAAAADRHGFGILHYDAHFDLVAERTDLEFDSVWLAPRGSL